MSYYILNLLGAGAVPCGTAVVAFLTAPPTSAASILGTAFSRRYVSDRSIPTPARPHCSAVATVVPLPTNGSRTTHGATSSVGHPHILRHPTVSRVAGGLSRVEFWSA